MNKLVEYSKEIAPMIRSLNELKASLKDFKDGNEEAQALAQAIKDAQQALKDFLETNEESSEILTKIKELENDVKQACRGAANGTNYKAAELKAFFTTRSKEDGVEKVKEKGVLFTELEEALE